MTVRRLGIATLLVVMWVAAASGTAIADAPGPTDYLSEITDIEPAVPGIEVEIVGGDSFVVLRVGAGVTVDVVGYSGEPYLRFLANGIVEENRLAPSKYLNEDRYAISDMPEDADPRAAPDWVVVADDGSYAWHDHRTHWMNEQPPPGRSPGDAVAEGVVPLIVNGAEVDVTVLSVWQDVPSPAPVALGMVAGIALSYAAWRRRSSLPTGLVLALATAAAVVGAVAYLSVPAETVPPLSLWVFPVTSALLALSVVVGKPGWVASQNRTVLLIAALELVAWGVIHWAWLWAAVLPTAIPFWLDRLVASSVLLGALGAAAVIVWTTAAPRRSEISVTSISCWGLLP